VTIVRLRGGSHGRFAERLRLGEQIVCCGEVGAVGGGPVSERRTGSGGVVGGESVGEAEEQRLGQENIALLTLYRRQSSAVLAPASFFCKMPMICSSVNVDRVMVRSYKYARL